MIAYTLRGDDHKLSSSKDLESKSISKISLRTPVIFTRASAPKSLPVLPVGEAPAPSLINNSGTATNLAASSAPSAPRSIVSRSASKVPSLTGFQLPALDDGKATSTGPIGIAHESGNISTPLSQVAVLETVSKTTVNYACPSAGEKSIGSACSHGEILRFEEKNEQSEEIRGTFSVSFGPSYSSVEIDDLVSNAALPPHLWTLKRKGSDPIKQSSDATIYSGRDSSSETSSKNADEYDANLTQAPQVGQRENHIKTDGSHAKPTARFRFTSVFTTDADNNLLEDESARKERPVIEVESPGSTVTWGSSDREQKPKRTPIIAPGIPGSNSWKTLNSKQRVVLRDGEAIGADAQPLSVQSKGMKMMKGMGWQEGEGLGVDKQGLKTHVVAIAKTGNSGIGAQPKVREVGKTILQVDPNWPTSENTVVDLSKLNHLQICFKQLISVPAVQQDWDRTSPENLARGAEMMRRTDKVLKEREEAKKQRESMINEGTYKKSKPNKKSSNGVEVRFLRDGPQDCEERSLLTLHTKIKGANGLEFRKTFHRQGTVVEARSGQKMTTSVAGIQPLRFDGGDAIQLLRMHSQKYILGGSHKTGKVGLVEISWAHMNKNQMRLEKKSMSSFSKEDSNWDGPKTVLLNNGNNNLQVIDEFKKRLSDSDLHLEVGWQPRTFSTPASTGPCFSTWEEALKNIGPLPEFAW